MGWALYIMHLIKRTETGSCNSAVGMWECYVLPSVCKLGCRRGACILRGSVELKVWSSPQSPIATSFSNAVLGQ